MADKTQWESFKAEGNQGRPTAAAPDQADAMLDRVMPLYDVVERHHVRVAAPAPVTFAAASEIALMQSWPVRLIFGARERIMGAPGTRVAPAVGELVSVPECRQEGAMRKLTVAGIAIGVLLVLSYTAVRPVAIQAGDQCFRCRRPIVERAMAAELMDGNRLASKFRAPGCLAKYLADHPEETGTIFVTDYVTGKWIRPEQAKFVPVVVNPDTGESDYRAFFRKADADAAALALHTTPIDWKTVMSHAWRVS